MNYIQSVHDSYCNGNETHTVLNREMRETFEVAAKRNWVIKHMWVTKCGCCGELHLSFAFQDRPIQAYLCRCEERNCDIEETECWDRRQG